MREKTCQQAVIVLVYLLLGCASVLTAADIDLSCEFVEGAEVILPGESVDYTVEYANLSETNSEHAFLELTFPVGAFLNEEQSWYDALTASHTDSLDNVPYLFLEIQWCDSLVVQNQGPEDPPPIGMNLPASTSGRMKLTVAMPMAPPPTPSFVIDEPPELAGAVDFNRSGCFIDQDCGPDACFGPRFDDVDPPAAGTFKVADDGSADSTFGCEPLVNDMTGSIALIRRGGCDFSAKALNAETAGAVGVAIMNNDPDQSIHNLRMTGGAIGHLVTIPVLMVSAQDGDVFEAAVGAGQTISGRMGSFEATSIPLISSIFHDGASPDTDPAAGNNSDSFDTRFRGFFYDGFESGDLGGWSSAAP